MREMRRILFVMLLALGLTLGPAQSAQAYYVQSVTTTSLHFASEVDRLIDVQRARYRLPAYRLSTCARAQANWWAYRLAQSGYLYHQWMGNLWYGCHTVRAGETLARGYNHAYQIVNAWMASPTHRAVLLDNRLTAIGVAARYANGRWTVVADYVRL